MKQLSALLGFCLLLFIGSCKKDNDFVPTLSVNETSIQLLTNGGTIELEISSNTSWKIVIPETAADWIELDMASGNGNAKVLLTVTANANIQTRRAELKLEETGTGEIAPVIISVEQGAFTPTLSIDKISLEVSDAGITEDIQISSNTEWKLTIPIDAEWVSVDKLMGTGNALVKITVLANSSSQVRKTTIKLEAVNFQDVTPVMIEVEQQPKVTANFNYEKEWEQSYTSNFSETQARSIAHTADGGYITASTFATDNGQNRDILLIKLSSTGTEEWRKIYDPGTQDDVQAVVANSDGYVVAGKKLNPSGSSGEDVWVLKTDLNGNKKWETVWSSSDWFTDRALSMAATNDGLIITGVTTNNTTGADVLVLKLDNNGAIQWNKVFAKNGVSEQSGNSVVVTNDGFLIAGLDKSADAFKADLWLLKLDANGNKVWDKTYAGQSFPGNFKVVAVADGYIITGLALGDTGTNLFKVDVNGNKQWERKYEEAYLAPAIGATPDGGFLLAGTSINGTISSLIAVKMDKEGQQQWSATYGVANGSQFGNALTVTADGFAVFGMRKSLSWVIKYKLQ